MWSDTTWSLVLSLGLRSTWHLHHYYDISIVIVPATWLVSTACRGDWVPFLPAKSDLTPIQIYRHIEICSCSPRGRMSDAFTSGVIGKYSGNDFTLKATFTVFLCIALYNSLELYVFIFASLRRYRCLYIWNLLLSTVLGVIPQSLSFILKYYDVGPLWFSVTFQSCRLSELHGHWTGCRVIFAPPYYLAGFWCQSSCWNNDSHQRSRLACPNNGAYVPTSSVPPPGHVVICW